MRTTTLLLSLLFANGLAFADMQIPANSKVMSIGTGYDSITGAVRSQCVDIAAAPYATSAGETTFKLNSVEDEYNFRSIAKQSLDAKYGAFSGSGSGTQEISINRFTAYMSVLATVPVTTLSIWGNGLKIPTLKKPASDLLLSDPNRFRQLCGDYFVAAETKGGTYLAMVEIRTSNSTERRDIQAKIGGSSGIFKGGAEASKKVDEVISSKSVAVNVLRGGDLSVVVQT